VTSTADRFEVAADVVATDFDGKDAVVLNLATKQYFTLNETATAIWSGIEQKLDVEGLVALLLERFEVSPERARASVLETLRRLEAQQLVRPCPSPA
jgi:Coenzyme PQQ synthesis protein D (PqqD)